MKTERNILKAFLLNFSFSIFELFGGLFTNSVAILSDAIHDFGDSISIGFSYILERISKRKPDNKYTYGYLRFSNLGALITTLILVVGSVFIIYNAVIRIFNPVSINYDGMLIFAIFGVVVNFIAAYYTKEGDSLNQKSVNLHMLEDVLGWAVVLVGALVIRFTGLIIIDPIMSIGVSVFILVHALKNGKEVIDVFLEKAPKNIKIEDVKKKILTIEHIKDVHHIHIWSMDGNKNFATLHIVIDTKSTKRIKDKVKKELENFNIEHVTIETEYKDEVCKDKK